MSEIFAGLSALVASYGAAAGKDTVEFDLLGVGIEVQDAQGGEVSQ
ncbi:hypothetical protein [Rathayibacter rathayi]|nr:hypothetical protein [Rathayibacter rathayi]